MADANRGLVVVGGSKMGERLASNAQATGYCRLSDIG
jgi:hypothetical protein